MQKKIMLIDGHSILNRAFYALPALTNAEGEYTNAVLGFLNILFKLLDEEKPDYVVAAFDLPAPTFRHKVFAEYKGTRKKMPDELRPQVGLIKNLLGLMNIEIASVAGYEADDILGTLAYHAENEGIAAVIISGDKDLLQIATDSIKVRIPRTRAGKTEVEDYYRADVIEKVGVTPQQFIDMKALMGDASDNIPGVPGIGEKTALKIITEFGSLAAAIENADKITPRKASENLAANIELAVLSKELATINTQTPVETVFAPFNVADMFNVEAFAEFKRLGLKSYYNRFDLKDVKGVAQNFAPAKEIDICLITEKSAAIEFFNTIKNIESAAYVFSPNADGLAICAGDATYISLPESSLLEVCAEFFTGQVGKISLDGKRDMVLLHKYGLRLNNHVFDVGLAAYVLNTELELPEYQAPEPPKQLSLFEQMGDLWDCGSEAAMTDVADIPCRQADAIFHMYPQMKRQIEDNWQGELYFQIELPLMQVLFDMEVAGIGVDSVTLVEMGGILQQRIDVLTDEIHTLAGGEFNINSPKQLAEILFDKLAIGGKVKNRSTAADVLEKLVDEHEIAAKIMEYRKYAKLKSTYADGLLNVIRNGRIHSKFNQTAASTGRISSSEPNLQNIPIRTELGRQMRKAFVPAAGCVFIDADYSQIELRILAGLAGDETMIEAFKNGIDIHTSTAAQVFHVDIERVTPDQRSFAKAVNFGIVYGIGAFSLSEDIGVSVKEAAGYIEQYFHKYPKVKAYLDGVKESAARTGYAETIFKRRRPIPEIKSANHNTRAFGERAAMNMPVQGSAADIIKLAMVRVHRRLAAEGLQSRLILQVHDELLIEAVESEAEHVKALLKEEMEGAVEFSVPLTADVSEGKTWFDTK